MSVPPGNPRSLTSAQRAERDRRVRADLRGGLSLREVAVRYGISTRQARRVMAARTTDDEGVTAVAIARPVSGSGDDRTPTLTPADVVNRVLCPHLVALDTLTEIARGGDNSNARLGAAGRLPGAAASFLAALAQLGLAPGAAPEWVLAHETKLLRDVLLAEMERLDLSARDLTARMEATGPLYRFALAQGVDDRTDVLAEGPQRPAEEVDRAA